MFVITTSLLSLSLFVIIFIIVENEVINGSGVPHVKIPSGELQGVYMKSQKGNTYEAFLGVPYAKPPIGELRFKNTEPVKPWIGVYNASVYGSDCLQLLGNKIAGSEDCLSINIFKPLGSSSKDGSLFDVMVHIHGGAFMILGSQSFKPNKLMDHNIVFVIFNYRLGPLGFLSTGDNILPGNLGLKDQVVALKWVNDNIKYFGGDPNKITLTGVSAGGASVHYHYMSPLSRGLFNKGISTSGAVLNPWALAENLPEKTKIIASNLGCPTSDSSTMVKCLIEKPANQIVQQILLFQGWMNNPFSPFGPTVEPEDADLPFITRHPYDILKDGDIAQVPWLCSFSSDEGIYPTAVFIETPGLLKELEDNWYEYAYHLLDFNFTAGSTDQRNQIIERITKYYLKDKNIAESVVELIQMVGDRLFNSGSVLSSLMQAAASKEHVYLYRFGYRGKYSMSQLFSNSNTNFGVCHGDEAFYVYDVVGMFNTSETENDQKMSDRLINICISFMKNGVPEFGDEMPLPSMKEALPKIRFAEIVSPERFTVERETDLGGMGFWSTIPLIEKLQLPNHLKDEL